MIFATCFLADDFDKMANFSFTLFSVLSFASTICFSASYVINGRPKGGLLLPPPLPKGYETPEENWFTQRLDHFDDSNRMTWKQRFFFNDTFRKKEDSPVFLMIGGEGAASPVWMVVGNMMKYAEQFGAFAIMLEHRFYGKSHPTRYKFKLDRTKITSHKLHMCAWFGG